MMKLCTTLSPIFHFILLLILLLPSSHATALIAHQALLPNQTTVPASTVSSASVITSIFTRLTLHYHQFLHPRSPVETPPTEYLPYPPPPNYSWPPGTSPATETPQPSEFDPPPGFYTDAGVGSDGSDGGNGAPAVTSQGTRIGSSTSWLWSLFGTVVIVMGTFVGSVTERI